MKIEIGIDCLDPQALALFWSVALGYGIGDLDGAGTYLDLVPSAPGLPVVYFQRVPEQKITKNRVHLDLLRRDPETTISLLLGLGATKIGDPQTGSKAAGGR